MTSKEKLLNILKNYKLADKGNGDFLSNNYQEELLNPVLKDLEDYEELKKLMGTPIQEIMKKLKVLEILKKILMIQIVISVDKVDAEIPSDKIIFNIDELNNEEKNMIGEWLIDGKD